MAALLRRAALPLELRQEGAMLATTNVHAMVQHSLDQWWGAPTALHVHTCPRSCCCRAQLPKMRMLPPKRLRRAVDLSDADSRCTADRSMAAAYWHAKLFVPTCKC